MSVDLDPGILADLTAYREARARREAASHDEWDAAYMDEMRAALDVARALDSRTNSSDRI